MRWRGVTLEISEFLVVYFCTVIASGVLFGSIGCIGLHWLLILVCRVHIGPCRPTARASPHARCRLPFGRSFLVALASVRYPSLHPQPVGPAHSAPAPPASSAESPVSAPPANSPAALPPSDALAATAKSFANCILPKGMTFKKKTHPATTGSLAQSTSAKDVDVTMRDAEKEFDPNSILDYDEPERLGRKLQCKKERAAGKEKQ